MDVLSSRGSPLGDVYENTNSLTLSTLALALGILHIYHMYHLQIT